MGRTLDRPALRTLRRELRRIEALQAATRALRHRDLSRRGVEERLERAAVAPAARAEAVATLERARLVDDERYARARAAHLADRGHGDAAIRDDLERSGVERDLVHAAIGDLEPEAERAGRLFEQRGKTLKTARLLARKGFSEESLDPLLDGIAEGA